MLGDPLRSTSPRVGCTAASRESQRARIVLFVVCASLSVRADALHRSPLHQGLSEQWSWMQGTSKKELSL